MSKQIKTKFEGPEKKLEIILFSPKPEIRRNNDKRWNDVVKASRADIISNVSTQEMDAYLLSESSLFVWSDRLLMITCGKTVLIDAVPIILEFIDRKDISLVFYERKNLLFPHEQSSDFEDNVSQLTRYFPGKSYRLGPANDDHVHIYYSSHARTSAESDVTLQLLMNDLSSSAIRRFRSRNVAATDRFRNFNALFPSAIIDEYWFSPYGYSLNGITADRYHTLHVTPQQEASYAGFETNKIQEDYTDMIECVLSIIEPRKFSIVLTTSVDPSSACLHGSITGMVGPYDIQERSYYEFDCGYMVTFLTCTRR